MNFDLRPGYLLYRTGFEESVTAGTTYDASGEGIYSNYALHTAEDARELALVTKARAGLLNELGYSALVTLKQVHGDIVREIGDAEIVKHTADPLIEGDALITNKKNVLIGILTADCVPVFFRSPDGAAGIAHCGWKGVFAKIHSKTAEAMRSAYGTEARNLRVWFGPNIRGCCYQVGRDLIETFREGGREPVFTERAGEIFFDIEETIRRELVSAGVLPENIDTPELCTFDHNSPEFFSYRRGDIKPRVLSFIGTR